MNMSVGIIGESWESPFVEMTLKALGRWCPEEVTWIVPEEFGRAARPIVQNGRLKLVPPDCGGFQDYRKMIQRLQRHCPSGGLLLVAAGSLPLGKFPRRGFGAAYTQDRVCWWLPGAAAGGESNPDFYPPPHRPPLDPNHSFRQVGALQVWTVGGGSHYFEGLAAVPGEARSSLWDLYGPGLPIFVYNTNRFPESLERSYDDYFILGSGLLGLSLVLESKPANGARVIVYDINADQIKWTQFLLENAGRFPFLEALISQFRAENPEIAIRETESHEIENVRRQQEWYCDHRHNLTRLATYLRVTYVVADLLSDPQPVIDLLDPDREVFFMYLDLFLVWHIRTDHKWVEHHHEMAMSLRRLLGSDRSKGIDFLPFDDSASFQIQNDSPFIGD